MSREQGPPKGGRGAPAVAGDLTPEAAEGGRRPMRPSSGRIPILAMGPLLRLIGRPIGRWGCGLRGHFGIADISLEPARRQPRDFLLYALLLE
jgi:hypothetical protein